MEGHKGTLTISMEVLRRRLSCSLSLRGESGILIRWTGIRAGGGGSYTCPAHSWGGVHYTFSTSQMQTPLEVCISLIFVGRYLGGGGHSLPGTPLSHYTALRGDSLSFLLSLFRDGVHHTTGGSLSGRRPWEYTHLPLPLPLSTLSEGWEIL